MGFLGRGATAAMRTNRACKHGSIICGLCETTARELRKELSRLQARLRKSRASGFLDATHYANQARVDEINRELHSLKGSK